MGWPVTDKEMGELKPFVPVLAMMDVTEVPELAGCTVNEAGEAVRPKPGTPIVLIRSVIRLLPFGLPQPVAKS